MVVCFFSMNTVRITEHCIETKSAVLVNRWKYYYYHEVSFQSLPEFIEIIVILLTITSYLNINNINVLTLSFVVIMFNGHIVRMAVIAQMNIRDISLLYNWLFE